MAKKAGCTCGEKRPYLMLIWARHFEGCPAIAKWPHVGVPAMVFVMSLLLGCAVPKKAAPAPEHQKGCVRYCTNSKACGDSCIPYESTCHKPEGSACTVIVHQ